IMKRILVAPILGIAASVATSYGQGVIAFDNYSDVAFAHAGQVTLNGQPLGPLSDGAVISLWAGQGVLSNSSLLQQIATTPLFTTQSGSGWYSMAVSGIGLGYAQIPASIWTGTQTVTFQVRGAAIGPLAGYTGQSLLWQETPDTAGGSIDPSSPNEMINGPLPFNVPIPEPSILALAGLGAAGMIFRKRQ
ncbi:MAG TPA: PEP-CTERM sorting domain-containing protein, partial [Verrucomicrobiae bacterium]|nr:PEP-CTERM sorting domain-containing protein [Verrucomicrobiae bacterium]